MNCLPIGIKFLNMKKLFFLLLTSLLLYSCKCEREEVGKNLLKSENREYLKTNKRNVEYLNEDSNVIDTRFDGAKIILTQVANGPEDCNYTTNEYAEENFVFGSYNGRIKYTNTDIVLELYNGIERNVFNILNISDAKYDNALQNITLNGFSFNNVLVLEKVSEGGSFNKIIYSKTNGIEFILFEDGTWYKRVE